MSEQSDDSFLELEAVLEAAGEHFPEEALGIQAFLDQSPLFAVLESDQRKKLSDEAELKSFDGGQVIFEEGSDGAHFHIIKSGNVVVEANFNGEQQRLAVLGPGSVVGEVAVVMQTPRTATVTSQGAVELYEIQRPVIEKMMQETPELRSELEKLILQRSNQAIKVFLKR